MAHVLFSMLTVAWLQHARISHAFQHIQPPIQVRPSFHQPQVAAYHRRARASPLASTLDLPTIVEEIDVDTTDEYHNTAPNLSTIQQWTKDALQRRGTSAGYQALEKLSHACQGRLPYDFNNQQRQPNVKHAPQLIPSHVSKQISSLVKEMEAQGFFSTNLDSVDGLPSFHLNLVSNGKPLFPKPSNDSTDTTTSSFGQKIQELLDLVGPYIYDQLLPQARAVGRSDRIEVSDIFLRRYGQDSEDARNGISAHYDVFSKVTSVIAMDNVAANGNNGLYTTATLDNCDTKLSTASNHASLRRYFPLQEGDGVIHSWDVLHGVDVLPGSDRTSLIVWFTEAPEEEGTQAGVSPWLLANQERVQNDDVTQFVLASALASTKDLTSEGNDCSHHDDAAMYQSAPNHRSSDSTNPQELYLQSAARGNAFALSRVGSLCEEEAWNSPDLEKKAQDVLQKLGTEKDIPTPLRTAVISLSQRMAWYFWWEATVRGNPSAQFALADNLMAYVMSSDEADRSEFLLLGAVIFGLAAQQGMEDALDRLTKVVGLEVDRQGIETAEDFQMSAVVQTAQSAMQ